MEYNVKVFRYANGKYQVRIYNVPIAKHEEVNKIVASKAQKTKKINKELYKSEPDLERSIVLSKNRTINSIFNISRSNTWDWFITITFDPKRVNRQNYDNCYEYLKKWLKSLKSKYPDVLYLFVPELHSDGISWHFHGLMSNVPDSVFKYWKTVDYNGKKKELYNLDFDYFGFNSVERVGDTLAIEKYITKYITKNLVGNTQGKNRYIYSKNCSKPYVSENYIDLSELYKYLSRISDKVNYSKTCDYFHNNVMYLECDDIGDIFDWGFSEVDFEEL